MGPTETQVLPSAQLLAGATLLAGTGGPIHSAIVSLYKSPVNPDHTSVLADFIVADFDGYADGSAQTWSAPFFDTDGTALVLGTAETFLCTGNTTPNVIYGYILATTARAALVAAYALDTPQGVNVAGDAVVVLPYFRYSGV